MLHRMAYKVLSILMLDFHESVAVLVGTIQMSQLFDRYIIDPVQI